MAFDQEIGKTNIRAQLFDKIVKGFALASYKFKQAVNISTTGAWTNFFFREKSDALGAQSGNAIKGIPRGANFPQASVEWERVSKVIEKYGLEENIPWEDIISNEIDVRNRTLLRIAEGVAKAVDDEIWVQLTQNVGTAGDSSQIQSFAISGTINGGQWWNGSSAAIIDDLLQAKQKIAEKNYPTNNLMAFISPRDHRSIMDYLAEKGAQFPSIGQDVANNGNVGKLAGITLIVSNSVSASYALIVVPKRVGTWKQLVPLQTITKEDPLKSVVVRSAEMGVTQLTDPQAAFLIKNTQQ